MALNGWVLRPLEKNGHPGTWCFYYLQVDPHGLTPFPLATKMVSKRLVHIYKIEDYLRKHGQPRSAGTGQTRKDASGQAVAGSAIVSSRNGHPSSNSGASVQESGSSLPPQAPFDDSHSSAKSVLQAKEKLEQMLAENGNWDKAVDTQGNPLCTQLAKGSSLPIMKGEARMPSGVTTEQVLGTILSTATRLICKFKFGCYLMGTSNCNLELLTWTVAGNEHLQSSKLLDSINGADQCVKKDTYKGIHPHLPSRTYTLAQGVFRSEPSSDNGDIVCVATSRGSSSGSAEDFSSAIHSTLDYAGWQIRSSSSSNSDQVEVVSAIKINLETAELPEFVKRILTHAYAGAPAKVGECMKKYGHAPYFLRWSPGKAALQGETEGEPQTGRFVWKFGVVNGKAAESATSEQVAWLQYSSTMYRKGFVHYLLYEHKH